MSDGTIRTLVAVLVFVVALVVYLETMAVTASFWDSGEFIATSVILGIPHSPGTPLYVLVGRVFSMLPLPMTATQRVNFLSVLSGALGVMMAYLVMVAVVRFMYGEARGGLERFVQYVGPVVGAMYLAFSDTYWTDATEAEVYALSGFVMGLCTLLALAWYRNPTGGVGGDVRRELVERMGKQEARREVGTMERQGRSHSRNLLYMIVYLLALGIGFHLGTVIVFGGIVLMVLMVREKAVSDAEFLVVTFGIGVVVADMTLHRQSQLTVLLLVLFAILVVWMTVSRGAFALAATGLFALGVSVHVYLSIRSTLNPGIDMVDPETWDSLYYHLRREQYPPIDIFSRKASFLFQLQHFGRYFREQYRMVGDVLVGRLNVGKALVAVPVALGLMGVVANYGRERRTWVLNFASLALNSLGLIIFLNFSDAEVRERDYFYGGAFYFFSIFIGIGAVSVLWMLVEGVRANAERVRGWMVVGAGVVLVVCSILPARYHWFRHDRSRNYIARDYAYNMLAGVEPDAILFTNGDNDTYPLWYIQNVEGFRTDVRVANRSLLNTSWYVKQLRDEEPRVPISFTDAEIESLRPLLLRDNKVAWKSDLTIHHIIQETSWKRPIYFAVTVPQEVWEPYDTHLEMQGMVYRLVPREGTFMMNESLMRRNFEDIYEFRGVLTEDGEIDDSVYKNEDTRVLFGNFALAAFRLAQHYVKQMRYDEVIRWSELSLSFDPTFDYAKSYLGLYYMRGGEPQKAIDYYTERLREEPRNARYWLMLSSIYENMGQLPAALFNLREGSRMVPDERRLFEFGVRIAAILGQREEAEDFARRWLEKHPNDREFMAIISEARQALEERQQAPAGNEDR
jgi:tetratricopeptide (TPR) repeat protein